MSKQSLTLFALSISVENVNNDLTAFERASMMHSKCSALLRTYLRYRFSPYSSSREAGSHSEVEEEGRLE